MDKTRDTKNQTNDGIADLPEITFAKTEVGRSYLTPAGHQVEVIEVVPGSHAIIMTSKGKEMKILADKTCRGPLPRKADVEEAKESTQLDAEPKSEVVSTNDVSVSTRGNRDIQVIPLGLLRETTRLLDAATKEMGFKSRSALIRAAIVALLRSNTTDAARTAVDAIEAEASA